MPQPDETPPVAPALTPEEWAGMSGDPWALRSLLSELGDGVGLYDDDGSAMGRPASPERHHHAGMAAHNAALPDGHGGKITRADVEACRSGRIACAGEEKAARQDGRTEDAAVWREASRTLDTLMAKLAALLPPEPDDAR